MKLTFKYNIILFVYLKEPVSIQVWLPDYLNLNTKQNKNKFYLHHLFPTLSVFHVLMGKISILGLKSNEDTPT